MNETMSIGHMNSILPICCPTTLNEVILVTIGSYFRNYTHRYLEGFIDQHYYNKSSKIKTII
jgi:hypothetical protein